MTGKINWNVQNSIIFKHTLSNQFVLSPTRFLSLSLAPSVSICPISLCTVFFVYRLSVSICKITVYTIYRKCLYYLREKQCDYWQSELLLCSPNHKQTGKINWIRCEHCFFSFEIITLTTSKKEFNGFGTVFEVIKQNETQLEFQIQKSMIFGRCDFFFVSTIKSCEFSCEWAFLCVTCANF